MWPNQINVGEGLHARLDEMVAILGSTKMSFWPELGGAASRDNFPYGGGSVGVKLLNGANAHSEYDHASGVKDLRLGATAAGDQIVTVDNANFSFGDGTVDGPFSLGAWVLMEEALGTARSILAKYGSTANLEEYDFRIHTDGTLKLELHDASASTSEIATGATALTPFKWQFCVATYDGGETDPRIHLYLNGSDTNSAGLSTETGAYVAMEDTAAIVMLGARDAAATAAQVLVGRIALPFITGKQLSDGEVQSLYYLGRNVLGI